MKKIVYAMCLVAAFFMLTAGMNDRMSPIELQDDGKVMIPEITAPSGTPKDNTGWLYVKDNGSNADLYYEDDGGTVTDLTSVGSVTTSITFEGATADDYETTVSVTDPTADRAVVIPNAAGTVMLSTLATNGADAANAVTGASNGLIFEGATADAYETTVTPTDATADRTVTLQDASGTVAYIEKSIVAGGAAGSLAVTAAMSGSVFVTSQATQFNLPAAAAGMEYTFVVGHASNCDINPDDADIFVYIAAIDAGDILRSATVGDTITIIGTAAGTWNVKAVAAGDGDFTDTIWTDGGAGA